MKCHQLALLGRILYLAIIYKNSNWSCKTPSNQPQWLDLGHVDSLIRRDSSSHHSQQKPSPYHQFCFYKCGFQSVMLESELQHHLENCWKCKYQGLNPVGSIRNFRRLGRCRVEVEGVGVGASPAFQLILMCIDVCKLLLYTMVSGTPNKGSNIYQDAKYFLK